MMLSLKRLYMIGIINLYKDMPLRKFIISVVSVASLFSCSRIDPQKPQSYLGNKIKLSSQFKSIMGDNMTVLVYYDLQDCISCKKKELLFWNDFLEAFNGIVGDIDTNRIVFIINIHPDDELSETFTILQRDYNLNIYYDLDEELRRMMPMPEESQYQCFLLDSKQRVMLIGKPIFNSSLFEKYLSFVSGI